MSKGLKRVRPVARPARNICQWCGASVEWRYRKRFNLDGTRHTCRPPAMRVTRLTPEELEYRIAQLKGLEPQP